MVKIVSFWIVSFWISGVFAKYYHSSRTSDTVMGRFYKPKFGPISFIVNKPLEQMITYSEDTMIVYYPHEKKAFKIKSLSNVITQSNITSEFREIFKVLKKSGYIFLKKERKEDTTLSYFAHEKLKTTLKIAYDKKGRVFEVSVKDQKGKLLYSTKALNYQALDDSTFFPKEIITITQVDTETFVFDSLRLIKEALLPKFIKNPVLSEDVSVELKGFENK